MTRAYILAALLAAASPLPGLSRALAAPPPAAATETQAIDQRIQALQQGLQITAEQLPQWNSFSQAMRDNASATDALFKDRAANAKAMNALDNMKSYVAVARAYADNTQKLSMPSPPCMACCPTIRSLPTPCFVSRPQLRTPPTTDGTQPAVGAPRPQGPRRSS
ncbi:MAG: Spy/CpxP family protein refolding chaperone [Acetobacteraceae bacterium]